MSYVNYEKAKAWGLLDPPPTPKGIRQPRRSLICPLPRAAPRVLSKQEWLERYATPGAEAEFYARLRGGPVAFTRPGQPVAPTASKPLKE